MSMQGICSNCGGAGAIHNHDYHHREKGQPGLLGCPRCKGNGLFIPDSQKISRYDNPDHILFPEEQHSSTSYAAERLLQRISAMHPFGNIHNAMDEFSDSDDFDG